MQKKVVVKKAALLPQDLEAIESDKEGEDMQRVSWQQHEILRKQRIERLR
jgi:hypothetical protein